MVAEDCGYLAISSDNNNMKLYSDPPNFANDAIDLTPVQQFYDGANVFITGSTGFLGKILVEKLLRSCPTVLNLYLLIREKKGKSLDERLDEMFDDVIFDRLKRECPKFKHKLTAVGGDCALPDLGLTLEDQKLLIDKVNIVFHVAATVRFDEHLKTAVAINIQSPRDLLRLAKNFTNLKAFVHVSTIYGNCVKSCIEEKLYPPAIDGDKLLLLRENLPETLLDKITPSLLGDYPNTYAYTKQIAEDMVRQEADNLPVGIFRPAIVVSTYREPIPAWINNIYGPTGVFAGVGVGLLRALHADATLNANIVPVDMCVNSLIVSAWEVAEDFQRAKREQQLFEIPVYNYESSSDQPITWGEYESLSRDNGLNFPTVQAIWYYCFSLYRHPFTYYLATLFLHTLPALLVDSVLFCLGKKPRLLKAYKKIHKFSKVITYFATKSWIVRTDRVRLQQRNMTDKDRNIFFCNMKELDWKKYFRDYGLGIRVYLLRDPPETLDLARAKWKRLYYVHQTVKLVLGFSVIWTLFKLINLSCSVI